MSCLQLKCFGKQLFECGWCARDPQEACGWPPKTVRSILAIIVLDIKHKWEVSVGLSGGLLSVGSGILGYYFGYRSGTTKPVTTRDIESDE